MTSKRFGMSVRARAPVESTMRESSAGQEGEAHGLRTGGDDGLIKAEGALALGPVDRYCMGVREGGCAVQYGYIAAFGEVDQASGKPVDDRVFPLAQLREINLRSGEAHAVRGEGGCILDDFCGVQERLRRDAADVQTDAAEHIPTIDDVDLAAQVRGAESCGVAARPCADDEEIGVRVGGQRGLTGRRRFRDGEDDLRGGDQGFWSALREVGQGFDNGDKRSYVDLLPEGNLKLDDPACHGRGNVHGCLVAFDHQQGLLRSDEVAGSDADLDDRHVVEVAEIGDSDELHGSLAHSSTRRKS